VSGSGTISRMTTMSADVLASVRVVAARTPGLSLLVLHGSRARGDARPDSDWDVAYLADDASFDPDGLLASLVERLETDRVDLADLARAGALFRHRVAGDGVVIFEHTPGTFDHFWLDAVHTWCDLEPVLTPAYEHLLQALPR
jgi:predicted nucleotidyltransferase